jgi:hypothetical protein
MAMCNPRLKLSANIVRNAANESSNRAQVQRARRRNKLWLAVRMLGLAAAAQNTAPCQRCNLMQTHTSPALTMAPTIAAISSPPSSCSRSNAVSARAALAWPSCTGAPCSALPDAAHGTHAVGRRLWMQRHARATDRRTTSHLRVHCASSTPVPRPVTTSLSAPVVHKRPCTFNNCKACAMTMLHAHSVPAAKPDSGPVQRFKPLNCSVNTGDACLGSQLTAHSAIAQASAVSSYR